MPINKIDMTDPIEPLSSIYNLGWWMTNYTNTSAPELPAGFVINIQGVAYIVEGGNVLPDGSPSDGTVYVKITPDAPSGDTATAEFTNTFSGTWSDSYNCWCDGSTIYLNIFMTKASTSYSEKGFWLNWREKKLPITSNIILDDLQVGNDLKVGNDLTVENCLSYDKAIISDTDHRVYSSNAARTGAYLYNELKAKLADGNMYKANGEIVINNGGYLYKYGILNIQLNASSIYIDTVLLSTEDAFWQLPVATTHTITAATGGIFYYWIAW